MTFLRQSVAVLGVVAVIMALGFVMKHTPASSLVTDQRQRGFDAGRLAPTSAAGSNQLRSFDGPDNGRDQGFDLSRVDDLVQSLLILGVIIAGVVVIDLQRRRRTPIVNTGRSAP